MSFLQPNGTYVATDVDLDIIVAIFQNCIDTYLISASSASGIVFGATLPHAPLPPAPIILRANQVNEDGTPRSQDQVAIRQRFVNEGLIIPECCLKISFVETVSSGSANVTVGGHVKRTCKRTDLEQEVTVQGRIFRSTLCGTSAPLTFTPDKIAATTMSPTDFSTIVRELATRIPPPPLPRVAKALDMLREIGVQAVARGLGIHIFVMELLKGETLRSILAKSIFSVSQQQKRDACNNVAVAVIMTFLKSLYWSRDQHADNVMISGPNTFTLDYGLMYNLIADEVGLKSLLNSLLTSANIRLDDVCKYFGVVTAGMTIIQARAAVRLIFNELYDMLRNPNLKELMKIDPAANMVAEIERISGIVFQMLSFFLLVDGLSNRYKHGTYHFQSREYMEFVFDSVPALYGFEEFLKLGSINLSVFGGPPGSASIVRQNMAYIVRGLQPALAICPISGPPRTVDEILLSAAFPGSPGQVRHVALEAARQAAIDQAAIEQARAEAEARRLSELEAERKAAEEKERKAAEEKERKAAEEKERKADATRKKDSAAAAAAAHHDGHGARTMSRSSRPPIQPEAKAKSLRGRSMTPPKKDAEAAVEAAAPPTGRLWRFTRWVSDRFNSNPANPPHAPNSDGLDGGTVKRRFRVQKRQNQTMRPCNIRRQRRTHAIRRRRNKNKTR